jgi:excisionase family DNA binding protein
MQLSLQQAAERLGKSVRQVRYLIQTGALPAQKSGGRWLIAAADLPLSEGQRAALERRERALQDRNRNIGFRCVLAAPRQHAADATLISAPCRTRPGLASVILRQPVPVALGDRPGWPFPLAHALSLVVDADEQRSLVPWLVARGRIV